jgi:lysophospholipase L1-like esterase
VALGRGKRVGFFFALALLLLVCAEGLCAIVLRFTEGQWPYSRPRTANYLLFEPHPDWVITPRKSVSITVLGTTHSHNTEGFRGGEFARAKTKRRILCIGGSTTYGIGIGDNETWPFYLDRLLQPDCEVLNLGIPGHSSVEHRKLLPQVVARYSPDVVVLQMGLNDLHNMNVDDLGPDYENFHQPALRFSASGACRRDRLPPCALLHGGVVLLETMKILGDSPFPHGPPPGHVSDSVDPRVVEIFSTNLDVMLRECLTNHIRVILLPHTMSPETITDTNYQWWAPYLTKKGIFNALDALNAVMRSRAEGDQVIYAGFLDGVTWTPTEFCDPSHLNANGNARLARLLQEALPWSRCPDEENPAPK